MTELTNQQQSKLTNVLMEYLNANDWKGLFEATQCDAFPQQHPNFYEDLSWEEENIEENCAKALDFILSKDPANLRIIWEIPGVQTMTSRKDESLLNEIQTIVESVNNESHSVTEMFKDLQSKRIKLRPINSSDAKFIFENWAQDIEVAKYLTWKPHQTINDTQNYIDTCIEEWDQDCFTWIIESKNENRIIGSFAARRNNHKLDIGYLLVKDYRNKGYMTEVIKSFVEEAFKINGIYRIGAVCDVQNLASKRVMEKAGMSFEGLLKNWLVAPNISKYPRDCFCLSIVKTAKCQE